MICRVILETANETVGPVAADERDLARRLFLAMQYHAGQRTTSKPEDLKFYIEARADQTGIAPSRVIEIYETLLTVDAETVAENCRDAFGDAAL